ELYIDGFHCTLQQSCSVSIGHMKTLKQRKQMTKKGIGTQISPEWMPALPVINLYVSVV
ncbi:hypothetical protein STEG23_028218, partial [Scotinomys teguina]